MTPKPIDGATAQPKNGPVTYDDRLLASVLIRCSGCGIEYYMSQTHGPRDCCIDCRWRLGSEKAG